VNSAGVSVNERRTVRVSGDLRSVCAHADEAGEVGWSCSWGGDAGGAVVLEDPELRGETGGDGHGWDEVLFVGVVLGGAGVVTAARMSAQESNTGA
jgi:hypothetical protein